MEIRDVYSLCNQYNLRLKIDWMFVVEDLKKCWARLEWSEPNQELNSKPLIADLTIGFNLVLLYASAIALKASAYVGYG